MSLRGPTNKFFYDNEHDVYLYYLTLEAAISFEDDFIYTSRGNLKMKGGWKGIAEKMTETFGKKFNSSSVKTRYERLTYPNSHRLNSLFEQVLDFRDKLDFLNAVINS